MCLIVVGWRVHPDYPLVLAANRDEFYARPTANAARWPDAPQVFGGIDLEAGGTWLGVTESGRFAAITNVREPNMAKGAISRGALTRDFLLADTPAKTYAEQLDDSAYAGFNLLLGDGESLVYCSNRGGETRINAVDQNNAPDNSRLMLGTTFLTDDKSHQWIFRVGRDVEAKSGFKTDSEIMLRYLKMF